MLNEIQPVVTRIQAESQQHAANLGDLQRFCRVLGERHGLARDSFLDVFWNSDTSFLYNAVVEHCQVRDAVECEAAVTAAAMLGNDVFSPDQLSAIWKHAARTLLVHRRRVKYGEGMGAFGLLAKNDDQRIFYEDPQYHSDVVWPRSTPYLVQLLKRLGQSDMAHELLMQAIDHQMCEGAIFYNHEVLSRAFGNNAAPDRFTQVNPVSVKNPIQFWSQWCDNFLDFVR